MREYIIIAKIEKYKPDTWFEVGYVSLDTGEIMIDDGLGFAYKAFDINTDVELKIVEEQEWRN